MAEASLVWLRQASCRSTDTSTSAHDVANARLHGKGKGSNGILLFGVCETACTRCCCHEAQIRQVQMLIDRAGVRRYTAVSRAERQVPYR